MTRFARLAAVMLVASVAAVANAGWWDDAGAARRTTLEDVRKDPDRWRDVTIVMDVRFASVGEPGTSYFTRFSAKEWRAVSVHPANATPDSMAKTEPYSLVFVRRGSDGEHRLADLAKGRRLQIRGMVRDSVKGDPWIEVFEVVADSDPLTPEEEAVVARGEELLAKADPAAAETVLRGLASKRTLPKAVQANVWRRIGLACWQQRRFAESVEAYTTALAAEPDDRATVTKLAAARAALAGPAKTTTESADAASVPSSPPTPPAGFGTPIPAPRSRPSPSIAAETSETPAPSDGAVPPPPPKPKLSGPK